MNKTVLMGRLVREPELKYTSTGNKAVCSFTLAINRRFSKDEADFINIVAWEKTAEFCGKYFEKGRQVAVVGRIQTRTYDNAEGKKVYVTEVVAEEAYFADSKKESSGDAAEPQETHKNSGGGGYVSDDCDLPF